jgi:hypothetical protein
LTRTYYRLCLTAVCALAAFAGPVLFLEDRFRTNYLLGGLAAALITWGSLVMAAAAETNLPLGLLGLGGLGAAALSWGTISLVALFEVLPHALRHGLARFDPVWLMGGFSPLAIPAVAWWRMAREHFPAWQALLSGLFRFSVPLFIAKLVAGLAARGMGLPRQFVWLFLFTGVMFLVLDGLGIGEELPMKRRRSSE